MTLTKKGFNVVYVREEMLMFVCL